MTDPLRYFQRELLCWNLLIVLHANWICRILCINTPLFLGFFHRCCTTLVKSPALPSLALIAAVSSLLDTSLWRQLLNISPSLQQNVGQRIRLLRLKPSQAWWSLISMNCISVQVKRTTRCLFKTACNIVRKISFRVSFQLSSLFLNASIYQSMMCNFNKISQNSHRESHGCFSWTFFSSR